MAILLTFRETVDTNWAVRYERQLKRGTTKMMNQEQQKNKVLIAWERRGAAWLSAECVRVGVVMSSDPCDYYTQEPSDITSSQRRDAVRGLERFLKSIPQKALGDISRFADDDTDE